MIREESNEADVIRELIEALDRLPTVRVVHTESAIRNGPDQRIDAVVEVDVADARLSLVTEIKNRAFPRDVREAAWQLQRAMRTFEARNRLAVPFVAATSISEGARVVLQEEGIGYFDLGGTLSIPVPHAFILIDRPPTKRSRRAHDAIFQGKRGLVLQAVFRHRDRWLGISELARETGVSPATVSETMAELDRRDWVTVRGGGPTKERRLRNTGDLLDNWMRHAEGQKPPKIHRYYVPVGSPQAVTRQLAASCDRRRVGYAVTAEAAADHYAPHLSAIKQVRCRLAPSDHQDEILAELEARPVAEGWNLGLIETKSRGDVIVGDHADGIAYADPIQVWLDLLHAGGRSRDAAAHLRTELFGSR